MRVALICPYAWDDPGGVQTHIRELAESTPGPRPCRDRDRPGSRWSRPAVGEPGGPPRRHPVQRLERPHRPAALVHVAVRETLRRFGPDVVHAHEPFTPSTSMWATLGAAVPVVATFHSGASRSRLYDVDRAGAPQDRASHLDPGRGVGGRRRVRGLAHRRRVRDRAQRRGGVPVRRRGARRSRSGHEAPVRRAPRRAEGVPHRGRSLRDAGRRASGSATGRGG